MNMNLRLLVFVALLVVVVGVPPEPTWPKMYKSCVHVQTKREIIKAGWYMDAEHKRMRLDRYSLPTGLNYSTAQLLQYYISEYEDFDYACSDYGPPLYEFIYLYDIGKMLSLFPAAEPPYRTCKVSNIFNKFPNSPLLQDLEFVEEAHDNITTYYHWRSEFFLFTMDYMFHVSNGLPYKLIANEEENLFVSFMEGKLDRDTFLPPAGVICS